MKKLIIILMLLSTPSYAVSPACVELGEISALIAKARISGMPRIVMEAGIKIDNTGMYSLDTLALNLIKEAYACEGISVNKFRNKTIAACEKLMVKKDKFEWLESK